MQITSYAVFKKVIETDNRV